MHENIILYLDFYCISVIVIAVELHRGVLLKREFRMKTTLFAAIAACSFATIASAQSPLPTENEMYVSYSTQYIHPGFGEMSEDGYFRAGVSQVFENGLFLQLEGTYHNENDWWYSGEGSALTAGITTDCLSMQCSGAVTFYDELDWDNSVYLMRVQVGDSHEVIGGVLSWDLGLGEYANSWREPSSTFGNVAFHVPFGEAWSAGVSINMTETIDRWDTERFVTYGVEVSREFAGFDASLQYTSTSVSDGPSWIEGGDAVTFRIARPLS